MTKPDLTDCTFIIPYYKDSEERKENFLCILNFLTSNFIAPIIVREGRYKPDPIYTFNITNNNSLLFDWYIYKMETEFFHRTKTINDAIKASKTPIICIYDTDVVFDPVNIVLAVKMLRSNNFQMVYPYSGIFVDIYRSYITDGIIKEKKSYVSGSVGGAVFINKKLYVNAGMENENLISHAPEDMERYFRMDKLGYIIGRIEGKCYHIIHPPSTNSGANHPFVKNNLKEYEKVKSMKKSDLEHYIKTWIWASVQ